MKHELLPPSHKQALLGEFMLAGEVPRNFSFAKAGRTVGRLLELGLDTKISDLEEDNPRLTEADIAHFWQLYLASLEQNNEITSTSLGKAEFFEAYEAEFKDVIEQKRDHLEWLGGGGFSSVFKLVHDSKAYAVRFPRKSDMQEVNKHLDAALLIRDIDNIEHVVAASFIDAVTVSEFVPGQLLRQYEASTLHAVSAEAFDELYASLLLAEERGVGFDTIGENLQYDAFEDVLTMLDVGIFDTTSSLYGTAASAIFTNICNTFPGILDDDWGAQRKFDATSQLHMLECFYATLTARSPDSPTIQPVVQRMAELNDRIAEYIATINA